ncbi:hypothetical protein M407DRAFT_16721 [Tulasnella calospora MUT 4182]|uniref:F-box domain-containing protein n=1 Tax=Tulasnella calospora MUT 4182 TaxID=1051891 RepID=A0A0C3QZB7_9AGAM|nr:hypothetical protein M407DRAFT_16721 [Tulasnella calospora MUT 4182]
MQPPSDSVPDAAAEISLPEVHAEKNSLSSDFHPAGSPDLSALDREIAALDITLVTMHKNLHHQLAETRKLRDTLGAISRLPTELMIEIFLNELEEVAIKEYYPRVMALSQVCAAWYSIIHNTANFWAHVHSDFPLPVVDKILHKSRNTPLTVECGFLLMGTVATAFVDMLIPSAKRIRSLAVSSDFAAWSEATTLVGPKLERLEYRAIDISNPVFLGGGVGRLDGLRELTLQNACLPWSFVSLKGLETLRLLLITSGGPLMSQLRSMIAESPSLRYLILNHVSISPGPQTDTSTITLPSLRQLHLIQLSQSTIQSILNAIRAPACLDTNVTCYLHPVTPDPSPVLLSLSQTIPHIQSAFNEGYQLCINVTSRGFRCYTERERYWDADEPRIEVEMQEISPYKALDWFLNLLKPPPNRSSTLTLGPDFNILEPSFAYAVNHKLRFVTSLHLTTDFGVDPVLKQLGRQVTHHGTPSWPMPRLSTLNLGTACFSGSTLIDTLKNRYKGRKGGKKGKSKGPRTANKPVPLTSLVVVGQQSMDEEYSDEVEEILGPGVMDWDIDGEDYDEDYSYDDDMDYWDEPYHEDHPSSTSD